MSHITEISVTGLAGRNEVYSQKLNRDVNIFFGLNGSGKTSLLRIIHAAMRNNASLLEDVPFLTAEIKIYSIKYKKEFTRIIKRRKSRVKQSSRRLPLDTSESYEERVDRAGSLISMGIKPAIPDKKPTAFVHRYLPTSRLYINEEAYGDEFSSEEELDLAFARSLERLWISYSAEILSQVSKAQQEGLASILKAILAKPKKQTRVRQGLSPEVAYKRLSSFLGRQESHGKLGSFSEFEKRYLEDQNIRSVVTDINEVEQGIEKAMAPRQRLQKLIENMFVNTKVIFQDKNIEAIAPDKTKINLTSLSSGQKHVLKIFIEVLAAEDNALLVDEPEISMHIDWQKKLVASMRQLNPEVQLVLATHSPEIMADVPDDKIFRL